MAAEGIRDVDHPMSDDEYRELLLGIIQKATARLRALDAVGRKPRGGLTLVASQQETDGKVPHE